ncbi:MAG: tetratricopeptide repeat protein [Bdellovibrionaceae bacterium]|nr:tetratricopeptide repeat protein [Bdellovibrionales bacterium]MCB9085276.1 tetratricopeptide repeat protein [Pseudobdellovibrionaceae bacterium]
MKDQIQILKGRDLSVAEKIIKPESTYEVGKLYFERGDFRVAIDKITKAAAVFYTEKNFEAYLKCQNVLLRMYAEMEESEKIQSIKETLQDLVLNKNVELNSKTYYTLALCASYKGQHKVALEYLEKSLALALSADAKEDICYAIHGLAIVYHFLGRYEDALKEIYNLQVFFQVLDLPELRLSSQVLNGHILLKMGKYEQALDVFWQCYDILKEQKNLYMYVSLLFAMGITYADSGEVDLGRMYLTLAKRSVDPANLRYLARSIDDRLKRLGAMEDSEYDIVFDSSTNTVMEKKKGKVDFKNQFILLDMLRLFLKNPGEVYTKEALVERVWKQEYDPAVHDNKIYVTIKRLRKMIEPDYDKPKYIYRAKNGYYLNKNARVLFDNHNNA